MKERIEKLLLIIIGFALLMLLVLIAGANNQAEADGDSKIDEISTQLNKLKDDKMQCLDMLTYLESIEDATGKVKHCVEFDELIMEKQAQLDEILHKEYEQVGLMME